jgi:hypothetical protein
MSTPPRSATVGIDAEALIPFACPLANRANDGLDARAGTEDRPQLRRLVQQTDAKINGVAAVHHAHLTNYLYQAILITGDEAAVNA